MKGPVVVVGNGVAGFAAASRLGEHGVDVTMVGPGLPHDRPPLSKRALAMGRLPLLADEDKLAAKGIRHLDGRVVDAELESHRLTIAPTGGGDPVELVPEAIVWATGLTYPLPPVAGIDVAHENSTGAGMLELAAQLTEDGRRVVVIGAGLIGTETAATLAARHPVTLVDMLDRPLGRFLPRLSATALETLDGLGVRFVGGAQIGEVVANDTGHIVRTATHGDLHPTSWCRPRASHEPPESLAPDGRALTVDVDGTLRVLGLTACSRAATDCVPAPPLRPARDPALGHALHSGRQAADGVSTSARRTPATPTTSPTSARCGSSRSGLAADAVEGPTRTTW